MVLLLQPPHQQHSKVLGPLVAEGIAVNAVGEKA
jgi:hypothetical protein